MNFNYLDKLANELKSKRPLNPTELKKYMKTL